MNKTTAVLKSKQIIHRNGHVTCHLLPSTNKEVADSFNDLLDVRLLERLDVDVASQSFLRYYRLYLQRLQHIKSIIGNHLQFLQTRLRMLT